MWSKFDSVTLALKMNKNEKKSGKKVKIYLKKDNFQNNELFYLVLQIHAGGGQ